MSVNSIKGFAHATGSVQVKTNMEMDSQAERMYKMVRQSQIEETKQAGEKKIEEIRKAKIAKGETLNTMFSGGMSKLQSAIQV